MLLSIRFLSQGGEGVGSTPRPRRGGKGVGSTPHPGPLPDRGGEGVGVAPHPTLSPGRRGKPLAALLLFVSLEVVAAFVEPGDDAAGETAAVDGFGGD